MNFTGQRHLLLLGAGHAHVQVLRRLAQHRPAQLRVSLLTPFAHQTASGMLPGYVAGHYPQDQCEIPLGPLLQAAGAHWVQGRCSGIDATARTVQLSSPGQRENGPDSTPTRLAYNLLSIDTGAALDRQQLETEMPGAAAHALQLWPMEIFSRLWPQVLELARQRPLSVVVMGAAAAGLELVFAAEQSIRRAGLPGSRFTLVTGGGEVAAQYSAGIRKRVLRQLQRRGITVLRDSCTGLSAGVVQLGSGATLACDAPILAMGGHAPPWLQGSGLSLSNSGHVLVNAQQQSTSHPEVFAAGDVASRVDGPDPTSGMSAVRTGPTLAHNLLASLDGQPLQAHQPPRHRLNLLSCGSGHAIASYGPLHAEGAWAWYWKDRIERAFVRACSTPAA
jgi:NADH dehydrogenase FAD-containing subunit